MKRQEQKRLARSGKPLIKMHVLGAAGGVTGSMNLFEYTEKGRLTRFLLDVGLTVENESADFQNRLPPGMKAANIDFIVISHAHLDHSGYLPKLVKEGFTGRVYVTEATKDLLEILLPDCAYLQEQAARRHNRREEKFAQETGQKSAKNGAKKAAKKSAQISAQKSAASEKTPRRRVRLRQPLYTQADVKNALAHLVTVDYDKRIELAPGVAITFTEAGHILGAAVVNLELSEGSEKRRICFTGNIGRPDVPVLRSAVPLLPADYLITESTYGNKVHLRRDRLEVVSGIINSAYERARSRNGAILIPAFAVGRAQTVLNDLRQLMVEKRIPKMPVYVDGPMTIRATEVHRKHAELFNEATAKLVANGIDPFRTPRHQETMEREASEALDAPQKEPFIVVGSSGMANGGRIVRHLEAKLAHPENTVVFVGYQGTGTLGQSLVGCRIDPAQSCASEVRISGKAITVRATIEFMPDYSGHADYIDLLRLMSAVQRKPKLTFVVHGSPAALEGMKSQIETQLDRKVVVPSPREVFVL